MIIVSACLAGLRCRYDGGEKLARKSSDCWRKERPSVCPEQLGGLPTPRLRRTDRDRVIRKDGVDVTDAFHRGAQEALKIARWSGRRQPF